MSILLGALAFSGLIAELVIFTYLDVKEFEREDAARDAWWDETMRQHRRDILLGKRD